MWMEALFSIRGRVVDAVTGRPLEGLHVRAYDRNLVWDDCLGCDDTAADGRFRIRLRNTEAGLQGNAVHVVVYGPELHQLHFTQPVEPSAAEDAAEVCIAVHTGRAAGKSAFTRTHAA